MKGSGRGGGGAFAGQICSAGRTKITNFSFTYETVCHIGYDEGGGALAGQM